jgi:ATP-dependent Clp protease protease subunit
MISLIILALSATLSVSISKVFNLSKESGLSTISNSSPSLSIVAEVSAPVEEKDKVLNVEDKVAALAGQDKVAALAGQDKVAALAGQDKVAALTEPDKVAAVADELSIDPNNKDNSYHKTFMGKTMGKSNNENTRFGFPVLPLVELSENHVTLRGEVNSIMVSKAIVEMGQLEGDEILIYISSPGGSISAGNSLIQYMNYLRHKGKTITCVADIAASMAFSIFQECDNRYVTPSSVLMQHQMGVGLKDQYENLKSYLKLLEAMNEDYLHRESARIGLTYDEFKAKILSDWWLYGEQNVESNVADQVVYVGCSYSLLASETVEKYKFRGESFDVVFSKCPLSRAPLRVVPSKDNKKRLSDTDNSSNTSASTEPSSNTDTATAAADLMMEIIKSMIISLEKKDVKCFI